jgi:hypothetical protein
LGKSDKIGVPQNSTAWTFDRIVAPMAVGEFLAEYFDRRILVLHREQPSYYENLISIQELDDFLAVGRPPDTRVFAVNAEQAIPPEDYTLPDDRIDVVRLYQLFADGATMTFKQMQERFPAFAGLCRSAEEIFNCPFQTNLYFTPANAQGFKTHYDTHDVFILQVAGSKRWRVYEPLIAFPLQGQLFDERTSKVGPIVEEFTLTAGDVFCCPRGIPHDAHATDDPSLHVTFGALVYTWAEVMIEAMAEVCLSDPAFRASLPPGYATGRAAAAAIGTTFRDLVERFCRSAAVTPAIDGLAKEFIGGRTPLVPEQRRQVVAADDITADSAVGARSDLIYRNSETEDAVSLLCFGKEIAFPRHVEDALAYALKAPRFLIRDLPGNLDDAGKIVLIRRLIREGLVMILA